MKNGTDAREALASLVADFQERLEADEDWGVDSYPLPEEMPRYSARAVEAQRAQQSESSGPADVSSAHQAPSKPVAKPAEVRQDKPPQPPMPSEGPFPVYERNHAASETTEG